MLVERRDVIGLALEAVVGGADQVGPSHGSTKMVRPMRPGTITSRQRQG